MLSCSYCFDFMNMKRSFSSLTFSRQSCSNFSIIVSKLFSSSSCVKVKVSYFILPSLPITCRNVASLTAFVFLSNPVFCHDFLNLFQFSPIFDPIVKSSGSGGGNYYPAIPFSKFQGLFTDLTPCNNMYLIKIIFI